MTEYGKPDYLQNDYIGDELDKRLSTIVRMLRQAPLDRLNTFLDVGMGQGQLTKWLSEQGKKVTGTGMALASYGAQYDDLRQKYGVRIEECSAEQMPFPDKSFDAVLMSHVIEHCGNVQSVLQEARRLLNDDGYILIIAPPHADTVFSGHVSVGWSVGQLMYLLLINGFDVKNGQFAQIGWNVAGFCPKLLSPLPPLRGDEGDIHILNEHDLFPLPVNNVNGSHDYFDGTIRSLNWPEPIDGCPEAFGRGRLGALRHRALLFLAGLIGPKGRTRVIRLAARMRAIATDERFRDKTRLS